MPRGQSKSPPRKSASPAKTRSAEPSFNRGKALIIGRTEKGKLARKAVWTGGWWMKRFRWYPGGCMGPYRSATIGYSRRELIADAILHINSITIGCIGLAVLAWRIANDDRLNPLAPGLYLYSVSLVTMFCCSALFNMRVGFVRHSPEKVRFIQLCDHSGIILLIAGTYTPFMLLYCCPRILLFVWSAGFVSWFAKATKSKYDLLPLHVTCFLAMGWSTVIDSERLLKLLPMSMCRQMVLGGALYTIGLIPWASASYEFHNAVWHLFVLAASIVFYLQVLYQVATPASWPPGVSPECFWSELAYMLYWP